VKPIRIAMIGTRGVPSTYGGIERAVEELSARLVAAGYDVTVYSRTSYTPTRAPSYRGIRLRYLPAINTKHLEALSHSVLATLDAIVRRYDVVHFHALGPSLCAPLARLGGLRVVTTVHALDFQRAKWGPVARWVLRAGTWTATRASNRTIVVSRQLRAYFEREHRRDTVYVPNGVEPADARSPSAAERQNPCFLFLGRLVPEKGVHTLIEAYRGLDTDIPLVIAGPASHSEAYEARLHALAAGDPRISFAGPVYDAEKSALLDRTYAFCQPSTLEGLPIALLEVMSQSICAIVSDIPEHLEVVSTDDGGRAAIVFRTGDVGNLREALADALAHPDEVAACGRAGLQIVQARYSWPDVARRVEEVYEEVVSR
jgi:glycosyltransferase involved in cell wall biosynthesis